MSWLVCKRIKNSAFDSICLWKCVGSVCEERNAEIVTDVINETSAQVLWQCVDNGVQKAGQGCCKCARSAYSQDV